MAYNGSDRRKKTRMPAPSRSEITTRLLITTERLERLATRLESHVGPPARHTPRKKTT